MDLIKLCLISFGIKTCQELQFINILKMIRGFFYKFNRSFKNLKNVIFHVKLLSPTFVDLV